jgi:transposase
MPDAHPESLRQRAVRAYEDGIDGYLAVAERFSIGIATVKRWVKLQRTVGTVEPRAS